MLHGEGELGALFGGPKQVDRYGEGGWGVLHVRHLTCTSVY